MFNALVTIAIASGVFVLICRFVVYRRPITMDDLGKAKAIIIIFAFGVLFFLDNLNYWK